MMANVGTLTRADLSEAIHGEIGLSRAECAALVDAVIKQMSESLVEGESVKISGFGSFLLRDKVERIGRNPKTGVEVPIAPRRVLTFRPSQKFRVHVAKPG